MDALRCLKWHLIDCLGPELLCVTNGWFIRCTSTSIVVTKSGFEVTALLPVGVMGDEVGFVLTHGWSWSRFVCPCGFGSYL